VQKTQIGARNKNVQGEKGERTKTTNTTLNASK